MNRAISLLTDFGLSEEYVGVMKGVILRYCPSARIIDLSHAVPPQDVHIAARMLASSYSYFAEGTIHLVVVDPGVGTDRAILLIEADRHLFIGPDNGVLSPFLRSADLTRCLQMDYTASRSQSSTFHGRDLMAPLAGRVAAGADFSEFGHAIDPADCHLLDLTRAVVKGTLIEGEVMAIDHFGNIATSITKSDIERLSQPLSVAIGNEKIAGLSKTYSDAETNSLIALIDSRGYLEIAANCDNAAQLLGCKKGDQVVVQQHSNS